MTKRKTNTRSKRFRSKPNTLRNFSLDPSIATYMAGRKDLNWSEIVETFLKVYIWDLQQQDYDK